MRKSLYVIYTVCMLSISACNNATIDEEFINTTSEGLVINSETVFSIDPLQWQMSFNRERKEFRVCRDNMSDYYYLKLNSVPADKGDKVKGKLEWTGKGDINHENSLTFVVEKVDRSGRLWLWCKRKKICALVQILD